MSKRSKLLKLRVRNIGCIGPEGIEVALDSIVCLVGKNNVGKSTILRAYELAQGGKFDPSRDRCLWAKPGEYSEVELDIHIPEGIGNIAEAWKIVDGDNRIIRSKWRWEECSDKAVRLTWEPSSGDWSESEKAGGADNVFKSRLPKPLRVGSLEDAGDTEKVLLGLALEPLITRVTEEQDNEDSELSQLIKQISGAVVKLGAEYEKRLEEIAEKVQKGYGNIFPGSQLKIDLAMSVPPLKIGDLLKTGSSLRIKEGQSETAVSQQGTGARRALFWSMLQVHNELKRTSEQRTAYRKNLETQIKKEKDEKRKQELTASLAAHDDGSAIPHGSDDPALPGYLLLIDEPENALHPMASRSAQKHLYELARDPDWQVMLTTHSPYFVNPLADHTTIVRLERQMGDKSPILTRTYISDTISFSTEEKQQLQAVQQMDVGFSEVFFGSYPLLVEGDTEHAAFIAAILEDDHELSDKVCCIRARGKAILPALVRMLDHFKIPFGILHDVDWPYNSKGKCGMWSMNGNIYEEVKKCRSAGLAVRHRYSIPDFERFLGNIELSKDKPLEAYKLTKEKPVVKANVQKLIEDLYRGSSTTGSLTTEIEEKEYLELLDKDLRSWATTNGQTEDPRLSEPEKKQNRRKTLN